MPIKSLNIQAITHQPWIYDLIQRCVGADLVRRHLKNIIRDYGAGTLVVDIGGGTGLNYELVSDDACYICLDFDSRKLKWYLKNHMTGDVVQADALELPIANRSIDVVLCTAVSHHISGNFIDLFFAESSRIIRPEGIIIFLDSIWNPSRRIGRLLWRYDQGSFPRTAETLLELLDKYFLIQYFERFSILHEYFIIIGKVT